MHGLVPDTHDPRDHVYSHKPITQNSHGVDLRHHCPEPYDQGQMESCTAHAVAAAYECEAKKQGLDSPPPSRLFIWYNARALSTSPDDVHKNTGSQIRNAIKSIGQGEKGACAEHEWSYVVAKSDPNTHRFVKGAKPATKPPATAYAHARQHTTKYERVNLDVAHLINCLDHGYPVVLGIRTYGLLSREPAKSSGVLHNPTPQDKKHEVYNHAVMIVGYIPSQKRFIVRNSYGKHWGDKGYFTMPYTYATQEGHDAWTVKLITGHR